MTAHLVLVGGFLGAGKTTLLLAAGEVLRKRGAKVAIITNDQGGELVDSRMADAAGFDADEITGGCFCCRFSELIASAEKLLVHDPDVIFAEPVGSCMDISATILQAVKKLFPDKFRLAPYTVLVDPARAQEMLAADADPDLAYLFRNQLLEADLVVQTKADRGTVAGGLPVAPMAAISALTGQGVEAWLDLVLGEEFAAGSRLLDVDYARYGEAEASLGWLNQQIRLDLETPLAPAPVVGPFMDALDALLTKSGAAIMHLKVFDQAPTGWLRASICSNGEEPVVEGELTASPSAVHELVVNLRAKADPETLAQAVAKAAESWAGRLTVSHEQAFRPSQPNPEHRFTSVESV